MAQEDAKLLGTFDVGVFGRHVLVIPERASLPVGQPIILDGDQNRN